MVITSEPPVRSRRYPVLGIQNVEDPVGDLFDFADPVDGDHDAPGVVEVEEGGGLLLVHLEPGADRLLGVVDPATVQQPLDEGVLIHLEHHHGVEAVSSDQPVQRFGLTFGAGKPVEDEAVLGVRLGHPLPEHLDGDLVGDVLPGLHYRVDPPAELGPARHVITEHVAGGDVGDAETLGDTGGLGPFACPGRPDEQKLHRSRAPLKR
jgi:hypothetical protein